MCRGGGSCSLPHGLGLGPPSLNPVDDCPTASVKQWVGPRLRHPLRSVGLRAVHHVGREICKEEEERCSKQSLQCPKSASKHTIDRPQNGRTSSLPPKRPSKQLYDQKARHEQDRKIEHCCSSWAGCETAIDPLPQLTVDQFEHCICDHLRDYGHHFILES